MQFSTNISIMKYMTIAHLDRASPSEGEGGGFEFH